MQRGKIISDIITRVKEVSDDAYLEFSQVGFWVDTYRDALVKDYLNDQISKGRPIDSFYLEREVLEVQEEEDELIASVDERLYVEVSKEPMALLDDLGVVKLETTENLIVLRSRVRTSNWVNDLPYASPSPTNLVFYRDGKKLIIQGLRRNKTVDFIATYIPSYASQELSDTDEFKIHDALLPQLLEMVEEIARREVFGATGDVMNTGEDENKPQ